MLEDLCKLLIVHELQLPLKHLVLVIVPDVMLQIRAHSTILSQLPHC